ncbi:MAG: hypothetical protein PHS96_09805 [Anaerolineales bacterium]|nr:hypothetical protein [Anaerolineales bacterium]
MAEGIGDELVIPFLSHLLDRRGQVDHQRLTVPPVQDRLPVLGDLFQSLQTPAENLVIFTFIQPLAYRHSNDLGDAGAFPPGDLSQFFMLIGF